MLCFERSTPLYVLLVALWGCASTTSSGGKDTRIARLRSADGERIQASLTYRDTGSGTVWVQLPDGEFLSGEFSTGNAPEAASALLVTPWGPITTVSVPQAGTAVSRFALTGNRGSSMRCVSFPRGSGAVGGCRDSRGRQYELYH